MGWAKDCAEVMSWGCSGVACPGTFQGNDGMMYTCQHAIDEGWAKDCAEVISWGGCDRTPCPGKFVASDGKTYDCQYAVDQGWAANCDVARTWGCGRPEKDGNCPGTFQ